MTFNLTRRTFLAATALVSGSALAGRSAFADAFPSRKIDYIIPYNAGGMSDNLSRLIGERLTTATGQQVINDYKPGAGGAIGANYFMGTPADGYTLLQSTNSFYGIIPFVTKVQYKPLTDLVPIAGFATSPLVLVVPADSPYRSVRDVVAAAKASPGTVTYGSPGNGTSIHLAGDLFEKAAGIKLSHIPYKGSNPALMDALAGNVDLLVSSLPSAMGQIKSGKLRPLAVTSAKRSSSLPDVPTVAESGFKDFDVSTWYGVFAPAGTPAAVVTTLNTEINKLLATPDMKAAIQAQGAEAQAMSPTQLSTLLKNDYTKWKGIVEASGAKIE